MRGRVMKRILSAVLAVAMVFAFVPATDAANAAVKKPAKVTKVRLANPVITSKTSNAMTLSWKKAKKAKLYVAYKYEKKWKKLKKTKKRTVSTGKLKYGKTYKFKVRAFNGKKKGKFSAVVSVKVLKNGRVQIKDSAGVRVQKALGEGYKLVQYAKRHVGGNYKSGGSHLKDPAKKGDKNSLDCTGFVQQIYMKYANISLPGGAHSKMINAGLKIGKEIKSLEAAQMGDIVFYKLGTRNNLQHVAICAGNGKVIDASRGKGGVYVHAQYSKKPYKIVRVLRSGGGRQVFTAEERLEYNIEQLDKNLKQYYLSKGLSAPTSPYTFKTFYKNNKNIISDIYGNKEKSGYIVYIVLNSKASKSKNRKTYLSKLVLPPAPELVPDASGNIALTGDIENYYKTLTNMGWLMTGNYQLNSVSSEFGCIESIAVKNGQTYVNISDGYRDDTEHQIIFNGNNPVRSYRDCKEGDKYILPYDRGNGEQGYPMLVKVTGEDTTIKGAGVAIYTIGEDMPLMYDYDGNMVDALKYSGFRNAVPRININWGWACFEKFTAATQYEWHSDSEFSIEEYDEQTVKDSYNSIVNIAGSPFDLVDGTKVSSYAQFKKLCETGMDPYTDSMRSLLGSVKQSKASGYYAKFQ